MEELLFPCLSKRCYKPMNPTFRPLVKVLGLSKSYGRRRVLNQLEFDVASGSGLVVKVGKPHFLKYLPLSVVLMKV